MFTRSLLVVGAILLLASPAFSQFGQNYNRLNDLAARLSRDADNFARQNYDNYVNGTRNLRRDIEAAMLSQQFAASAQVFARMVQDRRQRADLRDAFEMVRTASTAVDRYNTERTTWNDIQRLLSDIARELNYEGGGGGQNPDTGGGNRSGRMTWIGRVDDDVRIRIRGGTAEVETVGGTPYNDGISNFTNSLPYRRVSVRVVKRRGRGEVYIEQQPSRENDFTAVVRIKDPRGGASEYEFELSW